MSTPNQTTVDRCHAIANDVLEVIEDEVCTRLEHEFELEIDNVDGYETMVHAIILRDIALQIVARTNPSHQDKATFAMQIVTTPYENSRHLCFCLGIGLGHYTDDNGRCSSQTTNCEDCGREFQGSGKGFICTECQRKRTTPSSYTNI